MTITVYIIIAICTLGLKSAASQTADEWLKKVDKQMMLTSAEYTARMTIHSSKRIERVFGFEGLVAGEEFALLEYTTPPRQKGTRYLKRGDNLWIYFPRQDRTLQIQGHMLRQGVQGGDLSFEDLTESSSLLQKYESQIVSETDATVTLHLRAKDLTVSYPFREIIIDKKLSLPVKSVYHDASDRPIKELVILETRQFEDRAFPVVTLIRSLLVEDKWTKFEIDDIKFNTNFTEDTFTRKNLEK